MGVCVCTIPTNGRSGCHSLGPEMSVKRYMEPIHISSSGKDLEAMRNAYPIDACSKPTLILSPSPYSGSHLRGWPQPFYPISEQKGKGHP